MTGLRLSCLPCTASALLLGVLVGCKRGVQVERSTTPPGAATRVPATAGELQAGPVVEPVAVKNPLGRDENTGTGQQLFTWFNCAGCHGARGGGGIGPPLRDKVWIYGSDPASIYQSIAQGRPNGMPAFAGKIPDEQIWSLEMYIRSLGGAAPPVPAGGTSGVSPTRPAQR
ncbi:MAG TPA: c-type cytochrome [Gemmatimonadales bacterium]|nr:c-type cytochrome [Gemmatimonadales bacterium]